MKHLEFLTKPIDSLNIEPFSSYFNRGEKRKSLNGEWKFVYLKEMDDQYLEKDYELNELDTTNVKPTSHVLKMVNVMREDHASEGLPVEEVVKNAPDQQDGYIRVPSIMD